MDDTLDDFLSQLPGARASIGAVVAPRVPNFVGDDHPDDFAAFMQAGQRETVASERLAVHRERLPALMQLAGPLEAVANEKGIYHVFEDGGFRTLLLTTFFGLTVSEGKLGCDATDAAGRRYELKTVNLLDSMGREKKGDPGITTAHSLRQSNLDAYRRVDVWVIATFRGNTPVEAWHVETSALEPWFSEWEREIAVRGTLNNPKIPLRFIAEHGSHYDF